MKKIIYLSEISLPNTSAQAIQILKMCDSFSSKKNKVCLLINYCNKLNFSELKKQYNLKSNFQIKNLRKNRYLNFFSRIFLAIKALNYVKSLNNNNNLIISRSIISSIIFSFFGQKNILEIHHENSGLTKFIFNIFKNTKSFANQYFILIHKNLNKHFKLDKNFFLVLDDATDIRDFKLKKKSKQLKNSCVYTGSFYKGKGTEFIIKLSETLPKINFYLYGDLSTLDNKLKYKKKNNVFFKNYIDYNKIPTTLSKFPVILMPYSKKVYVKSKSVEVGRYMSPLKLFDYLASGKILIASKHENYKHILKNELNCFIIDLKKINLWKDKLENIFFKRKNSLKLKNIKKSALKTVKNYTWEKRIDKIIKFANEKIYD